MACPGLCLVQSHEKVRDRRDESEPVIRLADMWAGCIRAALQGSPEEGKVLEAALNLRHLWSLTAAPKKKKNPVTGVSSSRLFFRNRKTNLCHTDRPSPGLTRILGDERSYVNHPAKFCARFRRRPSK
jgi:hypothetical protein